MESSHPYPQTGSPPALNYDTEKLVQAQPVGQQWMWMAMVESRRVAPKPCSCSYGKSQAPSQDGGAQHT